MNLKLILKGFIVGIGKIIPGVSGSMLAYSLGIYEPLMEAVTNFFNNTKKNSKFLLNFGIGVFLAIILFSKTILFLLNNYYKETMYLFLGLIIGTLIPFCKNLKINKKNIFIFLTTIILFLIISSSFKINEFIYNGSFIHKLYIILLGGIDAITSIIPGISGTAIFMMLGSYEFVLTILSSPISSQFIFYGTGLFVGIILTCYLMNYLIKNKREETNSFVFALMITSIGLLLSKLNHTFNFTILILFIFGIIIGYKFDK